MNNVPPTDIIEVYRRTLVFLLVFIKLMQKQYSFVATVMQFHNTQFSFNKTYLQIILITFYYLTFK